MPKEGVPAAPQHGRCGVEAGQPYHPLNNFTRSVLASRQGLLLQAVLNQLYKFQWVSSPASQQPCKCEHVC